MGVIKYIEHKVWGMSWQNRKKGIEPDKRLTREYILLLLHENPNCQACDRELDMETRDKNVPNRVTIDRQDNSKGYVKDNLGVICWKCNRLKRNGTLPELKGLVAYMEGPAAG